MTTVTIDIRNIASKTYPDDRVVFRSPEIRENPAGGMVSTADEVVPLVNGQGSVNLTPGPVVVFIQCRGVADNRAKEGAIPATGPVALVDVLAGSFTYTPAIIGAAQQARSEAVAARNEAVAAKNEAADILSHALSLPAKDRRAMGVFVVTTDFGARGDGLGDDQPAIMQALTAAHEVGGGTVFVPPGDYALGESIAPMGMESAADGAIQGIQLIGGGHRGLLGLEKGGARLQAKGAYSVIGGWWNGCEITNFCMDVEGHFAPAIDADISKTTISNNELIGWVGYGMQLCTDKWKQNGNPTYLNKIESNHIQQQDGTGLYGSYLMWDSYIRFNNIGSTEANIITEGGPHKIHYNWLDGEIGPKHNIFMDNVGHTTEIIGNYLENCHEESIRIERPAWESGDRRLSFRIQNNQILNGGHNTTKDFPAVRIWGNEPPDDGMLEGLIFSGNQFFDDENGHWTHALEMRNIRSAVVMGNDWSNKAYTGDYAMKIIDCEDVEILGNVGGNALDPN